MGIDSIQAHKPRLQDTGSATPHSMCAVMWHSHPMHHLRSASVVHHFRIAAFLWFVICMLVPVSVGLLVQSVWFENFQLTMAGSGVAMLSLLLVIPLWAEGSNTNCPLCWTPVLTPKACSKHRDARKLMGSHRLRVALAILFKNQFRCPYCNESTALELRHSPRHVTDHWSQLD